MTESRGPTDLYAIAFLAGGVHRVVDTALVALVESGRVRVHAPGELAGVDPARRHPVEAAVLDAVGTRRHRSVGTIRSRLGRDERITGIGASLAADGLMRRRILRGRGEWCPTRAGRQVLRTLAEQPPLYRALDGGSAVLVALGGREAMADAGLRASIFEPPARPKATGPEIGRRLRAVRRRSDDPAISDYQARTALGGAAAIGFIDGGGGGF